MPSLVPKELILLMRLLPLLVPKELILLMRLFDLVPAVAGADCEAPGGGGPGGRLCG